MKDMEFTFTIKIKEAELKKIVSDAGKIDKHRLYSVAYKLLDKQIEKEMRKHFKTSKLDILALITTVDWNPIVREMIMNKIDTDNRY